MRHVAVVVGGLTVSLTGRRSSGLEHAMERIMGTLVFLASQHHLEAGDDRRAMER